MALELGASELALQGVLEVLEVLFDGYLDLNFLAGHLHSGEVRFSLLLHIDEAKPLTVISKSLFGSKQFF